MLNERQIELLPERIYQRLNAINTDVLTMIGQKIKKIGTLRPTDIHKLNRLRDYGSDINKIIAELARASEKNVKDIYDIYDIVAKENQEFAKKFFLAQGKEFIPYDKNEELQRYVHAMAKQTANEYINLTQHTAFAVFGEGKSIIPAFNPSGDKIATSLSDTYTQVIDVAAAQAQMGITDYQTAMRQTLKGLADSGIRTVDYATGYTRRLDTAVRQNILWAIKKCNQNVANHVGQQFGANGMEISMHAHPRPSHADFQGRQYSLIGDVVVNGQFYEDYYRTASNLLDDYGCLHFSFPIILGVSSPTYSDAEIAERKRLDNQKIEFEGKEYTPYEATQLQRKTETAMRHAKDRANIAKAAGDDILRREEQAKLNQLKNKYVDPSRTARLPTKMERLQVSGFRPVKTLNELKNGVSGGIMSAKGVDMSLEYQRYGRNKQTIINKAYINSGEYRNKFDNITSNKNVARVLYSKAKEMLEHRSGTLIEDMYWVDGNTGGVIASVLDETKEHGIRYPERVKKAILGKNNIITLHTHPNSMPPSIEDLNSNFFNGYKTGLAICHNGTVYAYNSSQEIEKGLYLRYINNFMMGGYSEKEAQLKTLEKLSNNFDINFWEVK